jgi:hypothetical protein
MVQGRATIRRFVPSPAAGNVVPLGPTAGSRADDRPTGALEGVCVEVAAERAVEAQKIGDAIDGRTHRLVSSTLRTPRLSRDRDP